jgi:uncharacterized membrane protein
MNTISASECIRFGWETFKKRPLILIGAFVLAMAISGITSSLLQPEQGAPVTAASTLMSIASGIIGLFVEIGIVTFIIRAHDSVETVRIHDLWNPKVFLYYLGGQILVGLTVIIGLVLLVIPGIIAALGLMFTSYLIVDKNRGPIEAYKESWRITKGHRWQLASLVAMIVLLNILGLVALVVGLLVTIPVSMLAMVHAYRKLEHGASEVTPVPVV